MDANELLTQITIPEPCSMDWETMRGDERTRHCEACGKHVHDLTKMKPAEAAALLEGTAANKGLCGRVYERPDGTLVITGAPASLPATASPFQFRIRTIMAVIAGVAALLGIARLFPPKEDPPKTQVMAPPKGMQRMVMGLIERSVPPPSVSSGTSSCAQPQQQHTTLTPDLF
jgi:hypothetical protein